MSKRLYFGTYIEFYVPIEDNGSSGTPVVVKKITNPIQKKGSGSTKKLKKQPKQLTSSSAGDILL